MKRIHSTTEFTDLMRSHEMYIEEDHPNPALGSHAVHMFCLNLLKYDIELEKDIQENDKRSRLEFDFSGAIADLLGIFPENLDDDSIDYNCRDWILHERQDVLEGKQTVVQFLNKLIEQGQLDQKEFTS